LRGARPEDFDLFAIHAGGRTILDAVEAGLGLGADALHWSRGVLRDFGNMSSATLMFVLQRILGSGAGGKGLAMAFGPGLAAESFRFERV
jgi:predicted naringenin-chalcone synthase